MRPCIALLLTLTLVLSAFAYIPEDEIKPGKAMILFSEDFGIPQVVMTDGIAHLGLPELDQLAEQFGVYSIQKVYPHEQKPTNSLVVDLSRWYRFSFPEEVSVEEVMSAYTGKPYIEYADFEPIRHLDYIPNDPMFTNLWHIFIIKADSAWDVTKSDTQIDIAIVDTGVDTAHIDLKTQLWINPGEDLNGNGMIDLMDWNGLDDDGNGYADDFWGWDFVDNNMFVHDASGDGHGTHCAGDASAATDNGTGIAGTGFRTRLMTLRCGNQLGIGHGFQGINYAGDNGADVISLSWGGISSNYLEQQTITAAWQQGSVICASAGNDDYWTPPYHHYPSGYDHVIAVAASNESDELAYFSNYSALPFDGHCDVLAPGQNILSTNFGGGYVSWSGTSMATPVCAGVCALIWSLMPPGSTPAEVETILFNTCDDIYPQNPTFQYGQLGYGRISAFNAILALSSYLAMDEMTLDDDGNNDGRPDPGETCELDFIISNDPRAQIAEGVTGLLSSEDGAVTITSSSQSFGTVMPSWTAMNTSPFVFTVGPTEPHFADFTLTLTTNSGAVFEIPLQIELGRPEILIVDDDPPDDDDSHFYVESFEELGMFVDVWDQSAAEIDAEEMLRYQAVIWETGTSVNTLSSSEIDEIEEYLDAGDKNLLFTSTNAGPDIGGTSFYSDYLHASFVADSVSEFYILGVENCIFSIDDTLFVIGGTGSGNFQSLESINPENGAEIAYQYQNSGSTCCVYYDGDYKMIYMSFPFETVSGIGSTPREEVLVNIIVWFGLSEVEGGEKPFIPRNFVLEQNYPNPFNPVTHISFSLPHQSEITLKVYNSAGQEVAVLTEGMFQAGYHTALFDASNLSSGLYFARLEAEGMSFTQKMVLLK